MPEEKLKTFKKPLLCELTEAEKVKKGHKAGTLKKKLAKVRLEMKAATVGHKDEIKNIQENLDTLLDELETGQEERQIECREVKNFAAKKAEVIRLDTNEVVSTRSLMAEEFQTDLAPVITDVRDAGLDDDLPPPKKRGRPRSANA
jgi:hypothetical protein